MSECKLCQAGDPSINVMCWDCRGEFHIHQSQYGQVPEGTIIMADCPSCGIVNCWHKVGEGVAISGPVLYYGAPILDLREKR
ncbi:hypothetical protein ES703_70890 [subsurface metagenome]